VHWLNLDGDRQADLSVHGGPDKAIYAYPSEHYPYWRERLDHLPNSGGRGYAGRDCRVSYRAWAVRRSY